uniref:RAP domain-containing protein n=1 Tax=Macrostomum lignano TaxID=282301 RepID=A0A1I8HA52_9PLAT
RAIIMQPSLNGCEANRQPHSAGSYYNSNFNSASGGDEDCNFAKLYRAVRCGRLVASWSESELLALAPLLSWHRDRLNLAELLAACQPEANSLHFGHVLDYANSLHYSVEFDAIGHDAKVDLERRVVDKCGLIGDFVSVVWPSAASSGEFESCDRPDQQARMLLRDILVAVRTTEARGFDAFNSAVASLSIIACRTSCRPAAFCPAFYACAEAVAYFNTWPALQPAAWRSLVRQLLACGPGRPIRWALSLAELDPGQSAWLAEMCASERRYPDLLAGLLTQATPPAARPAALRRLLMHESPDTRAWFLAAVTAAASGGRQQQQQQQQQSPTSPGPAFLAACRPDLLAELRSVASASAIASSPAAVILASQLVKLYAVLHCHAPTQPALTESELAALAELLTSAGPDATGGLTAVCVAFALIAYTAFNDTQQARLLAWLRRLVREPGRPDCRYKADVTGWVLRQIKECRAPLNTVMPTLIEAFAKSLVQPHDKWSAPAYEVIRQTDILAFYTPSACGPAAACAPLRCFDNEGENELEMSTIERDLTPQLLMLYYVLCYVDCLFDSRLEISRSGRSVHRYDSNLLSRIPVGYLVRHCQRRPEHYRVLYPLLVRLLVLRMPHLLLTELPIQDELALSQDSCPDDLRPVQLLPPPGSPPPRPTDFVGCSAAELASGGHALAGIMTRLNWLANRKADCLIPYADWLVRLLKASTGLDGPASQLVQERLKPLWLRLYQLMPRRLALATLSALRGVSLSEETIEKDPVEQVGLKGC